MAWETSRFPRLLQIKIDDDLYNKLVDKALKDKTTVSAIVRFACEEHLRKSK